MAAAGKTQRWIDLLASLLGRRMAIRFDEIAREVPAYARVIDARCSPKERASIKRMFERDKRELRALGVPLETIGEEGSEESAYRIRSADFYLPYLSLITQRGTQTPAKVDRFGYHALNALTFEADELRAVADGAALAQQFGNQSLAMDAESAVRKLAHDLPIGGVTAGADTRIVQPRARADNRVLSVLADALHERRRVRFEYHSLESDTTSRRTVDPYGLFFLNANWYLVARDVETQAIRNFRVNRARAPRPTSPDKELHDYEIPAAFQLREHARSRQAWELGDADAIEVTVEFRGGSGATRAAAALGASAGEDRRLRQFKVRRPDAFVRWLMSFAGEAIPLRPPVVLTEWRRQCEATQALYGGDAASGALPVSDTAHE